MYNHSMCVYITRSTIQHTAVLMYMYIVHTASTVNVFGIWSTVGNTVLHVCVPKCHVCKSVVMMSCSQRVCSYGYTRYMELSSLQFSQTPDSSVH